MKRIMTALVMLVLAMVLVSPSIELDDAMSNEAAVSLTSDSEVSSLAVKPAATTPVHGSTATLISVPSALRC